jgi:FdhD protein
MSNAIHPPDQPGIINPPVQPGITRLPVQKIINGHPVETDDPVAVEEPLEISLEYGPAPARLSQSISVTMRTPGQDADLATGFLFTEGILPNAAALGAIRQKHSDPNAIHISLQPTISPDITRLQRHFYTSSSCGVCGKTSIDALRTICPQPDAQNTGHPSVDAEILHKLPSLLRDGQDIFNSTGGLHAAALFTHDGELIVLREDIGRHNAVDKLIGHALRQHQLPLTNNILLLSGRACFELIQKAAMASIKIVAAVGPPSSLAIQLAEEAGITLIGFLSQQRFNIYSGAHRIRI